MKVEFVDHDEYDKLLIDLAEAAWNDLGASRYVDAAAIVDILRKLLRGEIVEP